MPELHAIETQANFTPPAGNVVVFLATENNDIVVKAKKSDGTTVTLSGGGSSGTTAFYKCASVDTTNQTWTGYLATFQNGTYVFSTTVTSGLTYGNGYRPVVNTVYNDDCTVIATLFTGIPTTAITINGESLSGTNWTTTGSQSSSAKFGTHSIDMRVAKYISITHGLDVLNDAWTIGFFCFPLLFDNSRSILVNNDNDTTGGFCLWVDDSAEFTLNIRGGQLLPLGVAMADNGTWTHVRLTHIGNGVLRVYVNGTYQGSATFEGGSSTEFRIGTFIYGDESSYNFEGLIDEVECFALTGSQIEEYGGEVSAPVPTEGY